MPSEITHKAAFRPVRYAGWLLVVGLFGWTLGLNGVGLGDSAASPMNPCPATAPNHP